MSGGPRESPLCGMTVSQFEETELESEEVRRFTRKPSQDRAASDVQKRLPVCLILPEEIRCMTIEATRSSRLSPTVLRSASIRS